MNNAAHRSCGAEGIKLLVADAVEVLEHPGEHIPRQRDLAGLVLGIQDRLGDQVRLDREDVEAVDRLVLEQGLAEAR